MGAGGLVLSGTLPSDGPGTPPYGFGVNLTIPLCPPPPPGPDGPPPLEWLPLLPLFPLLMVKRSTSSTRP